MQQYCDMTSTLLRHKSEESYNASCEFCGKLASLLQSSYRKLREEKDLEIGQLRTQCADYALIKEELKEVSANEKECRDQMHLMSRQIDDRDETIE